MVTYIVHSLSDPVVFLGFDPKLRGLRQLMRQIMFYLNPLSIFIIIIMVHRHAARQREEIKEC